MAAFRVSEKKLSFSLPARFEPTVIVEGTSIVTHGGNPSASGDLEVGL